MKKKIQNHENLTKREGRILSIEGKMTDFFFYFYQKNLRQRFKLLHP